MWKWHLFNLLIFAVKSTSELQLDDGCWKAAEDYILITSSLQLSKLPDRKSNSCQSYNDKNKTIIALLVSECHLFKRTRRLGCMHRAIEKVNGTVTSSHYESVLDRCMQSLNDIEYNSYTHFYTHIESICFLIHADLWQKQAQSLMLQLHENSFEVNNQLRLASENNLKLIEQQSIAINSQKNLLTLSNYISNSISASNTKLDETFSTIQNQLAKEHDHLKKVLSDVYLIINNVNKFQQYFHHKYLKFEAFIFYSFIIVLTRLLTCSSRSINSRHKLNIYWVLCYFLEVVIHEKINFNPMNEMKNSPINLLNKNVYAKSVLFKLLGLRNVFIATLRVVFIILGFLFWSHQYISYVDPYHSELYKIHHDVILLHQKFELLHRSTRSLKSLKKSQHRHNEYFYNDKIFSKSKLNLKMNNSTTSSENESDFGYQYDGDHDLKPNYDIENCDSPLLTRNQK